MIPHSGMVAASAMAPPLIAGCQFFRVDRPEDVNAVVNAKTSHGSSSSPVISLHG